MAQAKFLEWSIEQLSTRLKKKEISPVEVLEASLQLISSRNKELNAFITVMEEDSLKAAKQAEEEIMKGNYKGELHGVPIGLKDLICTKGIKTTFGSEVYQNYIPDFDAEVVTRLKDAGAIMIGKLNMHAFAYGTTGDRSFFGAVKNPHNLEKITGGSSSGSGAAVAAYQCYGSIGSDTGGSIRMPASMCGIVGMKPTFGRVSKYGAIQLCPTLDHLGPMTRTVFDNALMLNVLSGLDKKDSYSVYSEKEDFTEGINSGIKGKKIGIPTSFYFDLIDTEVQRVFDIVVENCRQLGAEIVLVNLPDMNDLLTAQQVILATEAYTSLEKHLINTPEQVEEEVRSRAIAGMLFQASEYIQMLQIKHKAIDMHNQAFEKVDVILTPTLPMVPTNIDQRYTNSYGLEDHVRIFARLTGPSNTTGFPAISVPGGVSECGLPIGVQFIGKAFAEKELYQLAYSLEQTEVYKSSSLEDLVNY
ncbi:Asp-tRNA(Asn)/Glu-tRNA(Gln) amidotransferase subunit GatA [bacterium LRH843]|nr:Asp-tRNA(Asn)/Glu-tRNA(Gln) amidotransferase subunit GatA [bacterium LRH843]